MYTDAAENAARTDSNSEMAGGGFVAQNRMIK
jgi:hypothetical protein